MVSTRWRYGAQKPCTNITWHLTWDLTDQSPHYHSLQRISPKGTYELFYSTSIINLMTTLLHACIYTHMYSYKKPCAHGSPHIHRSNVNLANPSYIQYNKQIFDSVWVAIRSSIPHGHHSSAFAVNCGPTFTAYPKTHPFPPTPHPIVFDAVPHPADNARSVGSGAPWKSAADVSLSDTAADTVRK